MGVGNGGASAPKDLAALLRDRQTDLIELWQHRVLSDPTIPEANRLPAPVLIDHVPDLIDRAVNVLERCGDDEARREEIGRAAGRGGESKAHAEARLASHFGLPSVLRELS